MAASEWPDYKHRERANARGASGLRQATCSSHFANTISFKTRDDAGRYEVEKLKGQFHRVHSNSYCVIKKTVEAQEVITAQGHSGSVWLQRPCYFQDATLGKEAQGQCVNKVKEEPSHQ